jgi:hypothetical protein
MHFTVLPADYYGSGRIGAGIILCRQGWALVSQNESMDPSMVRAVEDY